MKSEVWPFQGRYLFHLHTTSTDGELTVRQYFEYASQQRIQRLIFLEHIRRNPQYDVEAFVGEVKENSQRCRIPAVVGFEAKLLPDGRLDILDRHAAETIPGDAIVVVEGRIQLESRGEVEARLDIELVLSRIGDRRVQGVIEIDRIAA